MTSEPARPITATVEVTLKIDVKFTDQDLCDLLTTAFEGGISYWCADYAVAAEPDAARVATFKATADDLGGQGHYLSYMAPVFGGALSLIDHVENRARVLTFERLVKGIKLFLNSSSENGLAMNCATTDDLLCAIDANLADEIIQLAVMGEVVYG